MGKNALKNKPQNRLRKILIVGGVSVGICACLIYLLLTYIGVQGNSKSSKAAPPPPPPPSGTYTIPLISSYGPGGVGDSISTIFWFSTSEMNNSYSNGNKVSNWLNIGVHSNNATQTSNNRKPQFMSISNHAINGYPALRFDGSNDCIGIANNTSLNLGGPWSSRSLFAVIRTSNDISSRQVIYEEGGHIRGLNMYIYNGEIYVAGWNVANDGAGTPWNFSYVKSPIAANTEYIISMQFQGNGTGSGEIIAYLDGSPIGTVGNVGLLYAHSGNIAFGYSGGSYFENGPSNNSGQYFDGYIAEFIIHQEAINDAEVAILTNYLSSKYDIGISNDIYKQDNSSNQNYDHQMVGIGRIDAGNVDDDSKSNGIIRVLNPDDLNDDEFFMTGHDDGSTSLSNTADLPAGIQSRMYREWRISEMSTNGTAVDVGNLDMMVNLDNGLATPPSNLYLIIDTNNDGLFADETPIQGSTTIDPYIFAFSGVGDFSDGLRFTFGVPSNTILPIELTSFEVQEHNENVLVSWTVASETNNDYYTIERSSDGINFEELERVDGAGNSSVETKYHIIDEDPLQGVSYYRLRQTDFNGDYEEFQPQAINLSSSGIELNIVSAGPNPFIERLNVEINSPMDMSANLTILNMGGVPVHSERIELYEGSNSHSILYMNDYSPGQYLLYIETENNRSNTIKLLKQ